MEFRQLREVGVFSYLVIFYLKIHENGLGCCEAGNGHGFSWNRCLMRGPSMDKPQTDLGLLKTVWIACWTEIVHVNLLELDSMILLKMNALKCVWKMIC